MKYRSGYGAKRPLSAAQKLAEMACEREAEKKGVTLPDRFWVVPAWQRVFMRQVRGALGLLSLFDAESIFITLKKNPRIFSLNAAWVAELVQQEDESRQSSKHIATKTTPVTTSDTDKSPPRPKGRGGLRSRLKEANGQEKGSRTA